MSNEPKLVLVLGAGASHGARRAVHDDPAMAPPMGDQLAGYLLHWLAANPPRSSNLWGLSRLRLRPERTLRVVEFLRSVERARVTSGAAFEAAVAAALQEVDEPDGLFDDLNDVLSRALLGGVGCRFEERADLMCELIVRNRERLAGIITFNYDVLIEEALTRAGIDFYYAGVESDAKGVPLFKVHGSANWIADHVPAVSSCKEVARGQLRPVQVVPQPHLGHSNELPVRACRDRREVIQVDGAPSLASHEAARVMATYGPGKFLVWCRGGINKVRDHCAKFVEDHQASDVLVIGVRPPISEEGDETWFKMCARLSRYTGDRLYVSPNAAECVDLQAMGFRTCQATFDGYLAAGKRRDP